MVGFAYKPTYIEVCTLAEGLKLCGNNKTKLANELGINRGTLSSHINAGGHQLLMVVAKDGDAIGLEYINKGWDK